MPFKAYKKFRKANDRYGKKTKDKYISSAIQRSLRAHGITKPEEKFYVTTVLAAAAGQNLAVTGVGLMPTSQGTENNEVVGTSITARRLEIRYSVYNADTAGPRSVRFIIIKNMHPGNSMQLYSATSTFQNLVFQSNFHNSLLYPHTPQNWSVVWDQVIECSTSLQAGDERSGRKTILLGNQRVQLADGATGLVPITCEYLLWAIGSNNNMYVNDLSVRFVYTDS